MYYYARETKRPQQRQ